MNSKIASILLYGTLSLSIAQADTIIPGGYVSGTWTLAGSPYQVQGNITIHGDSTLTIEPAVDVIFQGYYRLYVSGVLEAIGTASDSIRFVPADTSTGWRGIYYQSGGPLPQQLSYCDIEYSREGGIQMQGLMLTLQVSHCTIAHCRHTLGGGVLVWNHGNLVITNSTIAYNTAESDTGGKGGGIYLKYNTLVMDSCIVDGNRAVIPTEDYQHMIGGGGIFIQSLAGNAAISNSIITDNFTGLSNGGCHFYLDQYGEGGGGISSHISDVTISNCLIQGNYANVGMGIGMGGGGGIYSMTLNPGRAVVSGCNISYNSAGSVNGGEGMGLYANYGLDIIHCTFFANNSPYTPRKAIALYYGTTNISNSIVAYNQMGIWNLYGNITCTYSAILNTGNYGMPPGFGVLDTVNANGDSCDTYFNLFMDPMFVDTTNGDLHLLASSPCIDAGDPASPLDPDSTTADMGRYFFDQRVPDIELSTSQLNFGTVTISETADLPLTIYNIGGDTLALYDLACDLSVFTTNWNPLDSTILPGDNLEITVTFAPGDTLDYADTLCIENNCELCGVELLGHGEALGVSDPASSFPKEFALRGPYPNPFNPTTMFRIELPVASLVKLEIHDISGKSVGTVIESWRRAGYHDVTFDGSGLSSGVYLYQLDADDFTASGKMVLLK